MESTPRLSRLPAVSLALTVIAFGVPGATFVTKPDLLAVAGVAIMGPSGATELRALYGGLELGLAAFFAVAVRRRAWHRPALLLQVLTFAGLVLGRAYGLLVDGAPGRATLGLMTLEGLGLVVGLVALRALSGPPPESDGSDR